MQFFQDYVREVMDRIEMLMRASLPPSPVPSPRAEESDEDDNSTKGSEDRSQDGGDENKCTPTKVLDVAKDNNR